MVFVFSPVKNNKVDTESKDPYCCVQCSRLKILQNNAGIS
jgi:hypothetical protein